MALDKLIDSEQLDACCGAEADAIRTKTGGTSQIAYNFAGGKGFADAIAAIPSGGGTIQETNGTFTIANGMSAPVTINLPFTPDLFVITTPDITMYGAQFNESVSFPFGATINGGKSTAFQTLAYVRSYPQLNQSDMLFSVVAEVGTNKVTITRAVTVRSNWGENNITNKSFTYYACKWEG